MQSLKDSSARPWSRCWEKWAQLFVRLDPGLARRRHRLGHLLLLKPNKRNSLLLVLRYPIATLSTSVFNVPLFTSHVLQRLLWQSSPYSGILTQFTYSLTVFSMRSDKKEWLGDNKSWGACALTRAERVTHSVRLRSGCRKEQPDHAPSFLSFFLPSRLSPSFCPSPQRVTPPLPPILTAMWTVPIRITLLALSMRVRMQEN